MNYENKVKTELNKQGRKLQWLSTQLNIHRKTLWMKLTGKTLTEEEKGKINSLLNIK